MNKIYRTATTLEFNDIVNNLCLRSKATLFHKANLIIGNKSLSFIMITKDPNVLKEMKKKKKKKSIAYFFDGGGIRIAPSKSFGEVLRGMPTNFPRTHDEIYNFYVDVHRAAYPYECVRDYEVTLVKLVEELFAVQRGPLGMYDVGDLDKMDVTKVAYYAATQIMTFTIYIPHFIHAGLCLYVAGAFGDHTNVFKKAKDMFDKVSDASLILEQVEIIRGDEDDEQQFGGDGVERDPQTLA